MGGISGAPVRPPSGRPVRRLPNLADAKAESSTANDLVCQAAADILERTGALRRGLETAILVSTKNQALAIKTWLTDHGVPAEVCDDVPVGVDSPLGKNLLYFFRWLLMPGDPFAAGLLTHSPLRPSSLRNGLKAWTGRPGASCWNGTATPPSWRNWSGGWPGRERN